MDKFNCCGINITKGKFDGVIRLDNGKNKDKVFRLMNRNNRQKKPALADGTYDAGTTMAV